MLVFCEGPPSKCVDTAVAHHAVLDLEAKWFVFEIGVVLQLKQSLKNKLQLLIRCGKGWRRFLSS